MRGMASGRESFEAIQVYSERIFRGVVPGIHIFRNRLQNPAVNAITLVLPWDTPSASDVITGVIIIQFVTRLIPPQTFSFQLHPSRHRRPLFLGPGEDSVRDRARIHCKINIIF